jgi:hypothetical protein
MLRKIKLCIGLNKFFGGAMGLLDLVVKFCFFNYLEQIKKFNV